MSSFHSADIQWRNAQTPLSTDYDDVYFSADDGAAESHFVFIQNNDLESRFKEQLTTTPRAPTSFVIAETGFGTGLNFIQAAASWRQHAKACDKLVFISCELHPLTQHDLAQALAAWSKPDTEPSASSSSFAEVSDALLREYPPIIQGMHTLELFDNVQLVLLFNDVIDGFSELLENNHPWVKRQRGAAVDAWFLDGFAPAKNPDMWTQDLFQLMARLSDRATTYASFTAAGIVRRGLKGAGFNVKKVKGFGKKREMIRGQFEGLPEVFENTRAMTRNTQNTPFWPITRTTEVAQKTALVVGAGIAGCTTARALAKAGIDTTLIDQANAPMLEASGNPQGVLFPKLSHQAETLSEFNLFSLLYADRYYQQVDLIAGYFRTGMLQLIDKPGEAHQRLHDRFSNADIAHQICHEEASNIAGTQLEHAAIWYPQTGWVRQSALREAFLHGNNMRFMGNESLQSAQRLSNGQWRAITTTQQFDVDMLVLCTASATNPLLASLPDTLPLPTKPIRGQVTAFNSDGLPTLNTVICHKGYICPSPADDLGIYTCGASYELNKTGFDLDETIQQQNLQNLADYLPEFSLAKTHSDELRGRIGFRCTTPDYLPMVGPLFNAPAFDEQYALLRKNARSHLPVPGTYHDGLFINIGHGSRGFGSTPISAALIAAYATGQPLPLPFTMAAALNPARFLIRDLMRNKR